jgi:hypothetical protein
MYYDSSLLSAALDDAAFPIIDEMMEYHAPEPPFLTFAAPGAARALSLYGRTVLATRDIFGPIREEGVETRIAGPDDPMVFPPGRFGLVHARWTGFGGGTLRNLVRWLKPGGILLVEGPDCYPAHSIASGPYRSVAMAVSARLDLPHSLELPALLMRHGLDYVGCRHQAPVTSAFQTLLQSLIEQGAPWPELKTEDLRDWPKDPVARIPALMNVLAWGVKGA